MAEKRMVIYGRMDTVKTDISGLSYMQLHYAREVLRNAVCQKIFCKCGQVLDIRRAVYMASDDRQAVSCAECFDKLVARLKDPLDEVAQKIKVDIFDGRVLFASGRKTA